MIVLYKVNSDESMYNKYREMANKLNAIAVYFQNPNITLTEEELCNWKQMCSDYESDIDELFNESETRIEPHLESEEVYEKKMSEIRKEHYWL